MKCFLMLKMTNVVRGIIYLGDMVMIAQKEKSNPDRFKGWWHFPGGKVRKGESLEDALHREINEETGSVISVSDYIANIHVTNRDGKQFDIHYFKGEILLSKLNPGDDVVGLGIVNRQDLSRSLSSDYISQLPNQVRKYLRV